MKLKARLTIIFSVIILAVLALAFAVGGAGSGRVIVADTYEVGSNPDKYHGREIRMRGFVQPGSIFRYGDSADFVVSQDSVVEGAAEPVTVPVHFTGHTQLPDTFEDGARVRIDGRLDENNRLIATRVEAKCASKYDADYADPAGSGAAYPMGSDSI